MTLVVREVGRESAAVVRRIMRAAFDEYRAFPLPSSALGESEEDVAAAIAEGGALIGAWCDGSGGQTPVASVRWRRRADALSFSRLAVVPARRGEGIGAALVAHVESMARAWGLAKVTLTARSQQPDNRPLYARLGYSVTGYGECYGVPDLVTKMEKRLRPIDGA